MESERGNTYTEARQRANRKYQKEKLTRFSLAFRNEQFSEVKKAAEKAGQTPTGYMKKAIIDRTKADGFLSDLAENAAEPESGTK